MTLTWEPYEIRGKILWQLNVQGFESPYRPRGGIGHVGHWEGRQWRAEAQVGFDVSQSVRVSAGSFHAARKALEREIDRRSIGWFGVDDVEFAQP